MQRQLVNLFGGWFRLWRWFPRAVLDRIAAAITEGERRHSGEVCFAVESRYAPWRVWNGVTAPTRARQVFAQVGAWDTRDNSGVLLYLQLAERRVEIVADRGIAERVDPALWQALCEDFATGMRAGPPDAAVSRCLARINALLAEHFPAADDNPRELPDEPVVL